MWDAALARRRCDLALADLSIAGLRLRLRRLRLHRHRPEVRHPRRLRAARRGLSRRAESASSSTSSSTTAATATPGSRRRARAGRGHSRTGTSGAIRPASIGDGRRPPNNWRSFFGGSAWTWEPDARPVLPAHVPAPAARPELAQPRGPRAALLDVVRTWLDRGVDGFRLDVFNTFFKDAALRSNPPRSAGAGGGAGRATCTTATSRSSPARLPSCGRSSTSVPSGCRSASCSTALPPTRRLRDPRHLIFDFALLGLPWSAGAFRAAIERRDASSARIGGPRTCSRTTTSRGM